VRIFLILLAVCLLVGCGGKDKFSGLKEGDAVTWKKINSEKIYGYVTKDDTTSYWIAEMTNNIVVFIMKSYEQISPEEYITDNIEVLRVSKNDIEWIEKNEISAPMPSMDEVK